jgi:hypothetical protein
MKSKTTFHWIYSNRIRLAVAKNEQTQSYHEIKSRFSMARFRTNWTSISPKTNKLEVIMKSKTTFRWLNSIRIRLAIPQKEQTRSYHQIKATFHWLDSNQRGLAFRQKRTNPKLS